MKSLQTNSTGWMYLVLQRERLMQKPILITETGIFEKHPAATTMGQYLLVVFYTQNRWRLDYAPSRELLTVALQRDTPEWKRI
jgi:hypothetical protein